MKKQVERKARVQSTAAGNSPEKSETKRPLSGASKVPACPKINMPRPQIDMKKHDPVRDPAGSTTDEDIARADGEGMAPVPAPRAHSSVKQP